MIGSEPGQSYLSGGPSGLPHDGGVWFSQQRLGKVWLLLQNLTGLVHPTAAERGEVYKYIKRGACERVLLLVVTTAGYQRQYNGRSFFCIRYCIAYSAVRIQSTYSLYP